LKLSVKALIIKAEPILNMTIKEKLILSGAENSKYLKGLEN
jgi:hypothetical protein